MGFGHIVLEGYCLHADESSAVPCNGDNCVSERCFLENHTICQYFAWCSAKNLIVMTDEEGNEVECRSYFPERIKSLESFFSLIPKEKL